jgi:alpha-galactosidase
MIYAALGDTNQAMSWLDLGHGARLLKVAPQGEIEHQAAGVSYEAEAATLTGSAGPAPCSACSGGAKVGNIGGASQVIFNNISERNSGIYRLEIDAMTQGPRALEYSVNGAAAQSLNMGGGSFLLPQSSTVPIALNAGNNTITFLNPPATVPT